MTRSSGGSHDPTNFVRDIAWAVRGRHAIGNRSAATAKDLKVLSDKTIAGVGYAESVAYDPRGNVFYTGDFGPDLKPAERDGKGKIRKISLDGKILEEKLSSGKRPGPEQAEGDLDCRQSDMGDRYRFDLRVRSQNQGRQETRLAHHLCQRCNPDAWRPLQATTAPIRPYALNQPIF